MIIDHLCNAGLPIHAQSAANPTGVVREQKPRTGGAIRGVGIAPDSHARECLIQTARGWVPVIEGSPILIEPGEIKGDVFYVAPMGLCSAQLRLQLIMGDAKGNDDYHLKADYLALSRLISPVSRYEATGYDTRVISDKFIILPRPRGLAATVAKVAVTVYNRHPSAAMNAGHIAVTPAREVPQRGPLETAGVAPIMQMDEINEMLSAATRTANGPNMHTCPVGDTETVTNLFEGGSYFAFYALSFYADISVVVGRA